MLKKDAVAMLGVAIFLEDASVRRCGCRALLAFGGVESAQVVQHRTVQPPSFVPCWKESVFQSKDSGGDAATGTACRSRRREVD